MTPSPQRTRILAAGLLLSATLYSAPARVTQGTTIQHRIDALLKHRLRPEPLPVELPNPFLLYSGGIHDFKEDDGSSKPVVKAENTTEGGPNGGAVVKPLSAPSNVETLMDCVARLKAGGSVVINGQTYLAINGVLRKAGDIILSDWNNLLVKIQVVRIVPGHAVFRYQDAETTLKY
jgi:hypothetical protein